MLHPALPTYARPRLLLVGDGAACAPWLQRLPGRFVGWLGEGEGEGRLGPSSSLRERLHREVLDAVVILEPMPREDAVAACVEFGVPALLPDRNGAPQPALGGAPAAVVDPLAHPPLALACKHAFDRVAAALALLAFAPLLAIAATLIAATMGGPVVFAQRRAGHRGRPFTLYKLRTMVRDAEEQRAALADRNEMQGPTFKIHDDPRVTPLGRWLRRSSIDELPQLLNVLRGEMSLVGPRPLVLHEQAAVQGADRQRLAMRPGITGLWQVEERGGRCTDRWMELDRRYVRTWSLALDLSLLLRTVPAVVLGRGAS